jgi:hypothetical protein
MLILQELQIAPRFNTYFDTEDTQNLQKTDKPDRKPVLFQRTFSSVFRAVFLHS